MADPDFGTYTTVVVESIAIAIRKNNFMATIISPTNFYKASVFIAIHSSNASRFLKIKA